MSKIIFLFSLVLGRRFIESYSQSEINSCSTECNTYLTEFKRIEFILNSLNQTQNKFIVESFNQINNKQLSTVDSASDNINNLLEDLIRSVQKEIIESTEKGISNSFLEVTSIINKVLDIQINSVNTNVDVSINAILYIIATIGLLPDASVLAFVQTPGTPFQVSISAVINKIANDNKKLAILTKKNVRNDLLVTLLKNVRKITSKIKILFDKIAISNIYPTFDKMIGQLKDDLKAGENLLVCGLTKVNMKIIWGINYLLGLCTDSMKKEDSERLLVLSGQEINPNVNE